MRARSVEGETRPGRGRARGVLLLRPDELLQELGVHLERNRPGAGTLEKVGILLRKDERVVRQRLRGGP